MSVICCQNFCVQQTFSTGPTLRSNCHFVQRVSVHRTSYVVTWNVKTYITHLLKCKMSQEWLKWCSDPPPTTTLNSTWLFGLRKFSCQTLGWWWGGLACHTPHHHHPKTQPDILELENFLVKLWGGGGGLWCTISPPPPPLNSTWLFGLRKYSCQSLRWWWGVLVWHAIPPTTTPKLNWIYV